MRAAIHLSETKYCSVGAMISKTAKIESDFEIICEEETVKELSLILSGPLSTLS